MELFVLAVALLAPVAQAVLTPKKPANNLPGDWGKS